MDRIDYEQLHRDADHALAANPAAGAAIAWEARSTRVLFERPDGTCVPGTVFMFAMRSLPISFHSSTRMVGLSVAGTAIVPPRRTTLCSETRPRKWVYTHNASSRREPGHCCGSSVVCLVRMVSWPRWHSWQELCTATGAGCGRCCGRCTG